MAFGLENVLGLLALLSLVPLIIIYLIRPKPKELKIPSLAFFIKTSGRSELFSLLQKFFFDALFFIQFFILIFLSLAIAKPFFERASDVVAENVVLIIDASASSQVIENGLNGLKRIDLAKNKAKAFIGKKTSIIVATSIAKLVAKEVKPNEALKILDEIKPTEGITKLGEALAFAGELLKQGKIIVFSDFSSYEGLDPQIVAEAIRAKGVKVEFIAIGKERANVGFIDLEFKEKPIAYIKNFGEESKEIEIKVGKAIKKLTIAGGDVEALTFDLEDKSMELEILTSDAFEIDNKIFLAAPEKKKIDILLITNNKSKFLVEALEASDLANIVIAEPPIIPENDFDIYIFDKISKRQIISGTFENILKKVENGSAAIVIAQKDSNTIDYGDLLPVKIVGESGNSQIFVDQILPFTKNLEGFADKYFILELSEKSLKLASTKDSPLIVVKNFGKGRLLFLGIIEEFADFKFSTNYPIFWAELVKWLANFKMPKELNFKTGENIILDSPQKILIPDGEVVESNSLLLERIGFYKLEQGKMAANLLNARESNIAPGEIRLEGKSDFELEKLKINKKVDLTNYLLALVALLFLLELFILKFRGDL